MFVNARRCVCFVSRINPWIQDPKVYVDAILGTHAHFRAVIDAALSSDPLFVAAMDKVHLFVFYLCINLLSYVSRFRHVVRLSTTTALPLIHWPSQPSHPSCSPGTIRCFVFFGVFNSPLDSALILKRAGIATRC
jgi:hypothetical protein